MNDFKGQVHPEDKESWRDAEVRSVETDRTKEKRDRSYPKVVLFFGIAVLGLAVFGPLLVSLIDPDYDSPLKLALFFAVPGLTFLGLYMYITKVEAAGGYFYKLRPRDWRTLVIQLLPGTTLGVLGTIMTPTFGWLSVLFGAAISVILTRRPAHPTVGVRIDKQNRVTLREKCLIAGMILLTAITVFLAWAWIKDIVPYQAIWGNHAEWFTGITTLLGFVAAVVTIAITRIKYEQEREQFAAAELSRKSREREVALGVQVDLDLEDVAQPRGLRALMKRKPASDLTYVCTIANNTNSSIDDIQIVYPEPHGSDRDDWDYTAPIRIFPPQKAGESKSYKEELPKDHPPRAECLALFRSMYRVQFTLNGVRWERDMNGLRDVDYSWTLARH